MVFNKIMSYMQNREFSKKLALVVFFYFIILLADFNNNYMSIAKSKEQTILKDILENDLFEKKSSNIKAYIFGKDVSNKSGVPEYFTEKLIGQGVPTAVSVLFEPSSIDGRHFAVAAQVSANSNIVGDKVGIFSAAQTGSRGSDIWSINSLVSWRPNDPDVNVQGYELDFNNMNMPVSLNPRKLKVGLNITSGGLYNGGYALFVDSTNKISNSWRQGLHISRNAVTDTGLFIAASNPGLSGTIVAGQISNSGDTILLQRASDDNPDGYIMRVVNAANSKNLLTINAKTLATSIGVSSSPAQLHIAPSTDPTVTTPSTYIALGLENNSAARKNTKGVSLSFYGRDTVSTQKMSGSLEFLSNDENWIDSDIVLKTRKNDDVTEKMRIKSNGHILLSGSKPNLSSCGPASKLKGTDVAGVVVISENVKKCTINFSSPYLSEPFCLVAGHSALLSYNATSKHIVVNTNGTDIIRYICIEI